MPGIYPELWLNRVNNKLKVGDSAPWLAGIPEIAADVSVIDGGSMSELNQIHIPMSDFDVDILIDNTDYPIPVQAYTDGIITLNLNKYQTKQVPISDDQATGSSYAQIDNVTLLMVQNLLIKKYKRSAFAIAPAANTGNTPVLKTTGRSDKFNAAGNEIILTDANGRLRLVYKDLVDHKQQYDDLEVPEIGRRLVLCSDHWNDLLLDRSRFGDLLGSIATGAVAPAIAGFAIYQYLLTPYYDGTNKLAFEAVPVAGQYKASISYYSPNIGIKSGMTRQYYRPAIIDPGMQSNTLAYRTYFMAVPKRNQYLGAIVSDTFGGA